MKGARAPQIQERPEGLGDSELSAEDVQDDVSDDQDDNAALIKELRLSLGYRGSKNEDSTATNSPPSGEDRSAVGAIRARPVSRIAQELADQMFGFGESGNPQIADLADCAADFGDEICLLVGDANVWVPSEGVVLGRLPGPSGVVVTDEHVSRRHIRVGREGECLIVADLGSTNGTLVLRRDEEIEVASTGVPLEVGDRIVTGNGIPLASVVVAPSEGSS